jgi:hypothetical protein
MQHLADHLAAGRLYGVAGICREILAEHVVGDDEEPFLAAALNNALGDGLRKLAGRGRPLRAVGRAAGGAEV